MREQLKEFTLLYAEDEEDVRANMLEYLRTYFKETHVATDGKEALEQYKVHQPDVVILDINMPKIGGLEVARTIRKNDALTRIIMLTAHTETDLLLDAAEIDMTRYLVKPVSPRDFKDALDKVAAELLNASRKIIQLGDGYCWHVEPQMLTCDTDTIELSHKESKLLALLISKQGSCVTIEDITAYVWDDGLYQEISRDSVKSQVNYLRKKLPPGSIENVYGKGYLLKKLT